MIRTLPCKIGLSFERLESFCRVAEASGVTRAAKGDPVKQSLYSRQIKELEEFFGRELVRRKGRGIALTDAGQRLHRIARECFIALSDYLTTGKGQSVEIAVGAGDSVLQWLIMPRLGDLLGRISGMRLQLLNLPTADTIQQLTDGMIDFAVIRQDAVVEPLQSTALGFMSYSLFIPVGLKPNRQSPDGPKLLGQLPLAMLEGEGAFRSALEEQACRHKIKLRIQLECSSFPLAARAVAGGNLAAILPDIAAGSLPDRTIRVPLSFLRGLQRKMCLASSPRMVRIRPMLADAASVFVQVCRFGD
jgi:DNA-binding transcriptional LysR family regulator